MACSRIPLPAASTPTSATSLSSRNAVNMPIAFEPAPTHASTTSGTTTVGGGVQWIATPEVRLAATVTHANWSVASATGTAFNTMGSSASPLNLLTWIAPVSNDPETIESKQATGSSDPLRTGTYSATLTFTLSTTSP